MSDLTPENTTETSTETVPATPPKRKPGRPKGSKNKKTLEREKRAAKKTRQAKKPAEQESPAAEPAAPPDDPLEEPVKPPDVPVPPEPAEEADDEEPSPTDRLGEDEADLALEMLFGAYNALTPMPVWFLIRRKVANLDQAEAQTVWATCSEIAKLNDNEKAILKRALKPKLAELKLSEDERLIWTCGMIFAGKIAAIMMATDPEIAAQYGAVLKGAA